MRPPTWSPHYRWRLAVCGDGDTEVVGPVCHVWSTRIERRGHRGHDSALNFLSYENPKLNVNASSLKTSANRCLVRTAGGEDCGSGYCVTWHELVFLPLPTAAAALANSRRYTPQSLRRPQFSWRGRYVVAVRSCRLFFGVLLPAVFVWLLSNGAGAAVCGGWPYSHHR